MKNTSHGLNLECFIIPRRGFSLAVSVPDPTIQLSFNPNCVLPGSLWSEVQVRLREVPSLLSGPRSHLCRCFADLVLPPGQLHPKCQLWITHRRCFLSPGRVSRWKQRAKGQQQRSGFIFGADTTVSSCKPSAAESRYSCSSAEILQANVVLLLHPMWLFLSVLFWLVNLLETLELGIWSDLASFVA